MQTQCTTQKCSFKGLGDRRVEAQFTAERITTDTGGRLLREVAEKMDLFEKAAGCFTDYREPDRREHEIGGLLALAIRPKIKTDSEGTLPEVERIVEAIREKWPEAEIILRADSGFARERIMKWCEENGVDYVFGLAKNSRLTGRVEELMAQVEQKAEEIGEPVRRFKGFSYSTLDSWSKKRRVVAKASCLTDKANPRFVVTSLPEERWAGKPLYEDLYCQRGEMENRIKEQQLGLFADRTSAHRMRVNQMRLWLASLAYVLVTRLRTWGLQGTEWARAQIWTLRSKLLKIGALVKVSVRRVFFEISRHYPKKGLFAEVLANLRAARATVSGATV